MVAPGVQGDYLVHKQAFVMEISKNYHTNIIITVCGARKSTKPSLCSNCGIFKTPWLMFRVLPQLSPPNSYFSVQELSNEVLDDPVPQDVSKIQQVKVDTSEFTSQRLNFQI